MITCQFAVLIQFQIVRIYTFEVRLWANDSNPVFIRRFFDTLMYDQLKIEISNHSDHSFIMSKNLFVKIKIFFVLYQNRKQNHFYILK